MASYPLSILAAVAAVAVALVFLVAGADKLRHRDLLPGVIANYRLLPPALVAPAAALLPLAEMAVAAGLLAGVWQPAAWAPLAAIALLLIFAAAMAINIGRGRRHIDCGCGHAGLRQQLGWGKVLRNVGLALALLPGLLPAVRAGLASADIVVALVGGGVVYLLILLFETLQGLSATAPGRARG